MTLLRGPGRLLSYSTWNLREFDDLPIKAYQALSWRISDHYPLWAEFLVR